MDRSKRGYDWGVCTQDTCFQYPLGTLPKGAIIKVNRDNVRQSEWNGYFFAFGNEIDDVVQILDISDKEAKELHRMWKLIYA